MPKESVTLSKDQTQAALAQSIRAVDYRGSIRMFVKEMWGLVPQPVKPQYAVEYEALCASSGARWEEAKTLIKADWFGDPVDPARRDLEWKWHDFRKGVHFTWQQNLILLGVEKAAMGDAKRLISVVSGHGIGKSATCSWVILWFLFCYYGAQVPVTAPTSHQMHDVLWKELSIWIKRMPADVREMYEWTSDYVRMVYDPEAWFARARTSTKENTEAIAGVHADNVAVVADEASGIPQQVFDTAEGALTSGNVFMLLISNGTQTTGYFFDTQHRARLDWQNFSFNGEESPIVDRGFVALKAKHGLDSEEYKIRVKGGFPGEDMMDLSGFVQLIPRERIGVRIEIPGLDIPFTGRKILGIDPSGEGKDKATFVVRDRFKARVVHEMQHANDRMIAEMALTLIDRFSIKPADVVIGAFGTGADVGKEIALATALNKGGPMEVYTVMEGNAPEKEERYNPHFFKRRPTELTNPESRPDDIVDLYLNLRALMYFRTRTWLLGGGQIVDDSVENGSWANELAVIRYKRSLQGNRIQLMGKKEMLKLGIPSPNKGDALSLTMLRDMDDEDTQTKEEKERIEREEEDVKGDERFNSI